jgi:general secretion pathway protein B
VADPQSPAERGDGVPYWEDLSLEFRSDFDPPRLDVHVYDSNPQRRFLLIELKKYREGDTLANGALIEEIQPDGILVFYRGTRFIYRK